MKKSTYTLCLLISVLIPAFTSCSSSEEPDGGAIKNKALKLSRLDLSGAKYITLDKANAARSQNDTDNALFKVDEQGTVSAVMLECVENADGSTSKVRTDIQVHPHEIFNLTSSWMFLDDCSFTCDGDKSAVHNLRSSYYSYESYTFNILVNKKTGKLYYVPDSQRTYFMTYGNYGSDYMLFTEDRQGNLYSQTHERDGLCKISLAQDGSATISKVGPADMVFTGSTICLLENGTIALIPYYDTFSVIYPNNGFEYIKDSNHDQRNYDKTTAFNYVNGKAFATTLIDMKSEDGKELHQTLQVRDLKIGTSYGSWSFSEPIVEIKQDFDNYTADTRWEFGNWIQQLALLYESNRYLFIGYLYAVDKQTHAINDLSSLSSSIIFPSSDNQYDGKSWNVWNDAADWFNCETLEGGRINFDTSSLNNYIIKDTQANIRQGEFIITGISQIDGKKRILVIDITNGQVKSTSEIDSISESYTLIPMN